MMRVFEEVRKNKSTEKDESTSGTRQEVDVYHFTQVTNVALLLSLLFCCDGLAAYRGFLIFFFSRDVTLKRLLFCRHSFTSFFYLYFSKFPLSKILFIFCIKFKGDLVCILHMFLMGPLIYEYMIFFFHD